MAGSLNHIIDENGCFTMEHIEKMHDAHQALDECFNIIRLLTDGDKSKINQVCRALGYPEINQDMRPGGDATLLAVHDQSIVLDPWIPLDIDKPDADEFVVGLGQNIGDHVDLPDVGICRHDGDLWVEAGTELAADTQKLTHWIPLPKRRPARKNVVPATTTQLHFSEVARHLRPQIGGDAQRLLLTDWRLCMCVQSTGKEFLVDWGPETVMREAMDRDSARGRDVWLVAPCGTKYLPDKPACNKAEPKLVRQRYVLGLVFNEDLSKVLLLRKNKPANQKGLLNGIGGKIEPGEMPAYAMTRECAEEVGLIIQTYRWVSLPPLEYPDAEVICFTVKVTNEEFMEARPMEDEALKHQILPVSLMDLVPGLADKLDEARLALA